MILLDNFAGTFPQWVSAAIALATFIVLIISKFTIKRINELVDVVVELKNHTIELANQTKELATQNEISQKRFDLEFDNALFDSAPFFRANPGYTNIGALSQITIILINKGKKANHVEIEKGNKLKFTFHKRTFSGVDQEETITLLINISEAEIDEHNIFFLGFEVFYFDDRNRYFNQSISFDLKGMPIVISTPRVIG